MIIRRERNMCRICYSTEGLTDFQLTGTSMVGIKLGTSHECCGFGIMGTGSSFDCVIIPEASKMTASSNLIPGNHFCGATVSGGLATTTIPQAATVCSKL